VFYNIVSEDGRVANFRSLVKAYINYTSVSGKPYTICRGILLLHLCLKISKNVKCTRVTYLISKMKIKLDDTQLKRNSIFRFFKK
jgi:hypothetical protein